MPFLVFTAVLTVPVESKIAPAGVVPGASGDPIPRLAVKYNY